MVLAFVIAMELVILVLTGLRVKRNTMGERLKLQALQSKDTQPEEKPQGALLTEERLSVIFAVVAVSALVYGRLMGFENLGAAIVMGVIMGFFLMFQLVYLCARLFLTRKVRMLPVLDLVVTGWFLWDVSLRFL